MKTKMIIAAMLFTAVSFAQTSNPSKPTSSPAQSAVPQTETKPSCPCCAKMTESKSSESCCSHHDEAVKSEMSCCQGKDSKEAMSCAKGDGSAGKECAKDQKACCQDSDKSTEQAKMSCCGGNAHDDMVHGHCAMMGGHDHGDMSK